MLCKSLKGEQEIHIANIITLHSAAMKTRLKILDSFSTHLTEYLGAGKSESGESDGSIMGTGEEEGERSGESGPSVAELRSSG